MVFTEAYLIEILTCLHGSLGIAMVHAGWQVDHELRSHVIMLRSFPGGFISVSAPPTLIKYVFLELAQG